MARILSVLFAILIAAPLHAATATIDVVGQVDALTFYDFEGERSFDADAAELDTLLEDFRSATTGSMTLSQSDEGELSVSECSGLLSLVCLAGDNGTLVGKGAEFYSDDGCCLAVVDRSGYDFYDDDLWTWSNATGDYTYFLGAYFEVSFSSLTVERGESPLAPQVQGVAVNAADEVVGDDFGIVPAPASGLLLLTALPIALAARRRRRRA